MTRVVNAAALHGLLSATMLSDDVTGDQHARRRRRPLVKLDSDRYWSNASD
jgi:hypothetical protein